MVGFLTDCTMVFITVKPPFGIIFCFYIFESSNKQIQDGENFGGFLTKTMNGEKFGGFRIQQI